MNNMQAAIADFSLRKYQLLGCTVYYICILNLHLLLGLKLVL